MALQSPRRGRKNTTGSFISALGLLGCLAGCDRVPDLANTDCCYLQGSNGGAATGIPVTDASVYLDTSTTMRGFIGDASHPMPVTLQQHLLRTLLLEALHSIDVGDPSLWGFGKEIFPLPHSLSAYASPPRDRYDRGETDIVEVLYKVAQEPSTVSVIVTDNAQDLRAPKPQRAPGFDRVALIRAVTDGLVKEGFGVWLVGFLSGYHGEYYSVLLAANSGPAHINKPIPLSSRRPSFCWVVSRDLHKGRQLVRRLHRELSNLVPDNKSLVQAIELGPGLPPRITIEEPNERSVGEIDEGGGDGDDTQPRISSRDYLRLLDWSTEAVPQGVVSHAQVAYESPRGSQLLFLLKLRVKPHEEAVGWDSLPPSAWRINVDGAGKSTLCVAEGNTRFPGDRGIEARVSDHVGAYVLPPDPGYEYRQLAFPYRQVTSRASGEQRAELPVYVAADPSALPDDHWLRSWSTADDTTTAGIDGKALYLYDVAAGILQKTLTEPGVKACLHLAMTED